MSAAEILTTFRTQQWGTQCMKYTYLSVLKLKDVVEVEGCDPQDHDVVKECWEASYSHRRGSASGAVDGLQKAALPPPGFRVPPWRKKKKIEATAYESAEETYREQTYVSHLTESWSKDTIRGGK